MTTIILSVAGSDSSAGAGIQADLKTITALGGYAATVITAVTAQNTLGVQDVLPMPPAIVSAQLNAVLSDLRPQGLKIGMLPNEPLVHLIADAIEQYRPRFTVCDPVMISTSGRRLTDDRATNALQERLFPLCTLITPNLQEAACLCRRPIVTIEEMEEAAAGLARRYHTSVLLKGGHLQGNTMTDVAYDYPLHTLHRYSSRKIPSRNLHGTGCTLSSAITTFLAQGETLHHAIGKAKAYMDTAIERGTRLHIGQGNGPLGHFSTEDLG